MVDKRDGEEMSMEEILASIRRYVSDDSEGNSSPPVQQQNIRSSNPSYREAPEVIKLTEEVRRPAESLRSKPKGDLFKNTSQPSEKTDLPGNVTSFTGPSFSPPPPDTSLLSESTREASAQALSKLVSAITSAQSSSDTTITLDSFMANLARPMIREWLDKNLPSLIETLVLKEIQGLTSRKD